MSTEMLVPFGRDSVSLSHRDRASHGSNIVSIHLMGRSKESQLMCHISRQFLLVVGCK